jgi:RNA-binding protein
MKVLGNISHIANSGKLIATTNTTPPAGAYVFTKDKKKIGRVNEVFGPVKTPYVSIKLFNSINKDELKNRNGEELYVSPNKNKRGKKARKKKWKRWNKNTTKRAKSQ